VRGECPNRRRFPAHDDKEDVEFCVGFRIKEGVEANWSWPVRPVTVRNMRSREGPTGPRYTEDPTPPHSLMPHGHQATGQFGLPMSSRYSCSLLDDISARSDRRRSTRKPL
jgi:hypothetical protein